jgi:hypothetical protein
MTSCTDSDGNRFASESRRQLLRSLTLRRAISADDLAGALGTFSS